jgi:3-oxoacyl-[acyl-carrier-protein] synthase II
MQRVVITGVGILSSVGSNAEDSFTAVLNGVSGVSRVRGFDTTDFTTKIAAQVPEDFDGSPVLSKKDMRKLDPFAAYGIFAADEAIRNSGLDLETADRDRIGVIMGSGIGGLSKIEDQDEVLRKRGPRRVTPHFVPMIMLNAMAGQVSIRYGLRGPCFATASACASSSHAIGLAFQALRLGQADVVITGGSEATVTPLALSGFCAARAMSTRNDEPEAASRPFDLNRDGFVMGEGAGVIVLEALDHARARGANILAELKGFGMTADAFHITAPDETGDGPTRSMTFALKDAGIDAADVQYVNAHGTSTPYNDKIETVAMRRVFGDHAKKIAVSSSKSMVGHLLGASGAVELIFSALSVSRNVVHPTLNYETPDPDCDLDYVPGAAREMQVTNAVSNSLGFGGHNASLVVGTLLD